MGHFLCLSLELAQIEVGISSSIFNADFAIFGKLLTDCWIKSLWEFISTYNIVLRNPNRSLPSRQRSRDDFIMELVAAMEAFTDTKMIQVN
jgi:hypothetical protein